MPVEDFRGAPAGDSGKQRGGVDAGRRYQLAQDQNVQGDASTTRSG